jgi:hypothetical protein
LQSDFVERDIVLMLWGRFTLHRLHDVIENSGDTYPKSTIQKRPFLAKRARVSNPPDCADPGLHPDRRRDDVTKRPYTGRTATRASVGRRHLLHSFAHRLRTRPPAFPGEAAFRRIPAPLECAGHGALFDGGTISSKKGVLPVPGPPNGFYFRFPTRKNDAPSRTRRGTRPQDGRRYAVPPSPTGQAPKSPAFQA